MSPEQLQIDQLSRIAESLDRIEALLIAQAKVSKALVESGGPVEVSLSTKRMLASVKRAEQQLSAGQGTSAPAHDGLASHADSQAPTRHSPESQSAQDSGLQQPLQRQSGSSGV